MTFQCDTTGELLEIMDERGKAIWDDAVRRMDAHRKQIPDDRGKGVWVGAFRYVDARRARMAAMTEEEKAAYYLGFDSEVEPHPKAPYADQKLKAPYEEGRVDKDFIELMTGTGRYKI
jgi:hypothetical protein